MLEHTMVEGASNLFRLEPGSVAPPFVAALRSGALLARVDAAVLTLAGPGAVTCVQGLLTNDIEQPGDGAFVYGALLTPKGMIVVDGWAGRLGTTVSYTVPAEGRERALGIFTHSVPPRLARVSDRTPDVAVYRLAGPRALAIAATAGLDVPPAPGRVLEDSPPGVQTARGGDAAPFVVQLTAPPPEAAALAVRLVAAGAVEADPVALELARILAGWPRLGAEVDEKTIPQEVRYDGVGGAVIRGEVTPGAMVRAAGRDARVVDLPFVLPAVGPA